MNGDELSEVVRVLTWFAEQFAELPEASQEATQAGILCTTAGFIVAEYMHHLVVDGDAHEDALRKTAAGELRLQPGQAAIQSILRGNSALQ